jgi:hypothetical protein
MVIAYIKCKRCLSFLAVRKIAQELHIFAEKKLGRVPS